MKCKRLFKGRALDHQALQMIPQQAANAVGEGPVMQSVSAAFGVSDHGALRPLAELANGGHNALLPKSFPRHPRKLNLEDLSWIADAVLDHNQRQFKFKCGLWKLLSHIRHLSKRQFKNERPAPSAHRVMKIPGLSTHKPLSQARQQYPCCYAHGRQRPARRSATKSSRSEHRSTLATSWLSAWKYRTGTSWESQGYTQEVQVTGQRFSLNMIAAVCPVDESRLMLHEGSDGKLNLFYPQAYSLRSKPDNTFWAYVKRKVSYALIKNAEEMKRHVLDALRST